MKNLDTKPQIFKRQWKYECHLPVEKIFLTAKVLCHAEGGTYFHGLVLEDALKRIRGKNFRMLVGATKTGIKTIQIQRKKQK